MWLRTSAKPSRDGTPWTRSAAAYSAAFVMQKP
jgi:hypothetical protein